ncbi:hypothetical protein CLOM_g14951 [Closterium sp. NIES-68]|nr:hypothetical protein CLOM_g14951 [Closterium sp. NIES-68]
MASPPGEATPFLLQQGSPAAGSAGLVTSPGYRTFQRPPSTAVRQLFSTTTTASATTTPTAAPSAAPPAAPPAGPPAAAAAAPAVGPGVPSPTAADGSAAPSSSHQRTSRNNATRTTATSTTISSSTHGSSSSSSSSRTVAASSSSSSSSRGRTSGSIMSSLAAFPSSLAVAAVSTFSPSLATALFGAGRSNSILPTLSFSPSSFPASPTLLPADLTSILPSLYASLNASSSSSSSSSSATSSLSRHPSLGVPSTSRPPTVPRAQPLHTLAGGRRAYASAAAPVSAPPAPSYAAARATTIQDSAAARTATAAAAAAAAAPPFALASSPPQASERTPLLSREREREREQERFQEQEQQQHASVDGQGRAGQRRGDVGRVEGRVEEGDEISSPFLRAAPQKPTALLLRMMSLAREEWPLLLAALLPLLVSSLATLALSHYAGRVVALVSGASRGSEETWRAFLAQLTETVFLMAASVVLGAVGTMLRAFLFSSASERVAARIKTNLFRCLLAQDMALYDSGSVGEVVRRLTDDTGLLKGALTTGSSEALRSLATAAAGLLLMATISPTLTGGGGETGELGEVFGVWRIEHGHALDLSVGAHHSP